MNGNGRHWIKGDMTMEITKTVLLNREAGLISPNAISPKAQVGDVAYCAWGGIKEVADSHELQVEAMEALVKIIDDRSWSYYEEWQDEQFREWQDCIEEARHYPDAYDFSQQYPTFERYWGEMLADREEQLGNIIAEWNDSDKRSWDDVRTSLTKAAANAKMTVVA
jgi:hypothetical protein